MSTLDAPMASPVRLYQVTWTHESVTFPPARMVFTDYKRSGDTFEIPLEFIHQRSADPPVWVGHVYFSARQEPASSKQLADDFPVTAHAVWGSSVSLESASQRYTQSSLYQVPEPGGLLLVCGLVVLLGLRWVRS